LSNNSIKKPQNTEGVQKRFLMVIYEIIKWKLVDYIAFFQSVEKYLGDVLPHKIPQDVIKIMYVNSVADAIGTINMKFEELQENLVGKNLGLYRRLSQLYAIIGDAILKIEYKDYIGLTGMLTDFYDQIKLLNSELEEIDNEQQ
jgi:hypothetical protein